MFLRMLCNIKKFVLLVLTFLTIYIETYAIANDAVNAGLSEAATENHFKFFLDLSIKGQNSHQLLTNRNYLDTVYAFETLTGLSLQSDINNKNDISQIASNFGKEVVENMWLELAALIYDPCIWKTIENEDIEFSNPTFLKKPEDLSKTIVGDECDTVGVSGNSNGKLSFEFKKRKLASPSFPGPAKDALVANDKPINDEGDELYADYSKFKFSTKESYTQSFSPSHESDDFDLSDYMEVNDGDDDLIANDYRHYSESNYEAEHGVYDPETDTVNPNSLSVRILSKTPRVYIVPNFATDEETDKLIALATKWAGDSKHDFTGFSYEQPVSDPTAYRIAKRMEALLDLKNDMGQTLRMRHYEGGKEEYHPLHTDWFEIDKHDGTKSNLIVTAMLCLSTPEEGGATYFPKAAPKPFRVKPRKGMLVAWYSCTEDGKEDKISEHEGELLIKGHKWTATNFLYQHNSQCSGRKLLGSVIDHYAK
jgi:prolyl 4-hydroxylase